jgi:hypothetical protein
VKVNSITSVGGSLRRYVVETATPHYRTTKNNIFLNNVFMNGQQVNPFNGSHPVTAVNDQTHLEFTLDADPAPSVPTLSGNMSMGVYFFGAGVAVDTSGVSEGNRILNCWQGTNHDTYSSKATIFRNNFLSNVYAGFVENLGGVSSTSLMVNLQSLTRVGTRAYAETVKPHGFSTGDFARIANVHPQAPTDPNDPNRYYYGFFEVFPNPTDNRKFEYDMIGTPADSPPPASSHTPAYATADSQRLLESLTYRLENGQYVALATTTYEHGLSVDEAVFISKGSHAFYNGRFRVSTVPTTTSFEYVMSGDPGADSTSGYFGRLWQVGNLVIENNVIELRTTWSPYTGAAAPTGIALQGQGYVSPYVFRQAVIRGNVIRHFLDASDPSEEPGGIALDSCEKAIVEDNTIQLDNPNPIVHLNSGEVRYFNNQTPSGAAIRGYNVVKSSREDELETKIEDALVLALS